MRYILVVKSNTLFVQEKFEKYQRGSHTTLALQMTPNDNKREDHEIPEKLKFESY